MTLSTAVKEAYVRADTFTRHLMAVDLKHSTFPDGHIRIINYSQDITIGADTYAPHAMQSTEPEVGHEPDNKVKLQIDGVSGTFQFWLAGAIKSNEAVYADMRPVVYNLKTDTVIDVAGVYPFMLLEAQYSMTACTLTLGHISPTNLPFPGKRYSPESHPMMYK